ncbi:hypothetical protein FKP32DRAFT_1311665 [Trametes sanguinea]|nr:hypothetical protein FKP32DRAFT_1311665 [Trametes sanguinea]
MRSTSFFTLLVLCMSAQALPLAITLANLSVGTLTTTDASSSATSIFVTPSSTSFTVSLSDSESTTALSTASPTETASDSAPTDSNGGIDSASQTGSPIVSADGTESDSASATTTDPSVLPSSTAPGHDSSSTDLATGSAVRPTSTSISFDIPDVPPACLALASVTQAAAAPTSSIASTAFTTVVSSDPSSTSATAVSSIAGNATTSPTATVSSSASVLPTNGLSNSTLERRIAQEDLPAIAQAWQDLCLVSGGDIFTNEPCVQLAGINGINALLADADPCAQQDNADAMIDFAKSPGVTNPDALIASAVAYRQHPRNALNINGVVPSTPFCQRAPRNAELAGVVNGQLDGVNVGIFGSTGLGLFAFGAEGSCPFGQVPDVTTCSCS